MVPNNATVKIRGFIILLSEPRSCRVVAIYNSLEAQYLAVGRRETTSTEGTETVIARDQSIRISPFMNPDYLQFQLMNNVIKTVSTMSTPSQRPEPRAVTD